MNIRSPKYKYDICLDHGAGAHLVAWASGLMVFFVTMALAVNLGLNTVTNNWVSGLSGSLTAEIKQPISESGRAGFGGGFGGGGRGGGGFGHGTYRPGGGP